MDFTNIIEELKKLPPDQAFDMKLLPEELQYVTVDFLLKDVTFLLGLEEGKLFANLVLNGTLPPKNLRLPLIHYFRKRKDHVSKGVLKKLTGAI